MYNAELKLCIMQHVICDVDRHVINGTGILESFQKPY